MSLISLATDVHRRLIDEVRGSTVLSPYAKVVTIPRYCDTGLRKGFLTMVVFVNLFSRPTRLKLGSIFYREGESSELIMLDPGGNVCFHPL